MKTATRVGATALMLSLMMGMAYAADAGTDVATRRAALKTLLGEHWEYNLKNSPEFASIIGDKRYNDKLSDFSQAAIESDLKRTAEFLKKFEAIDTAGFPVQEHLNKELMVRNLKTSLEGARFKEWQMPVLQNSGIHIDSPQLV
jgi:uncharacterized protein (DUF885 family)